MTLESLPSSEHGGRRLIFGIKRRRCIFSLSTFLEPLAYRADPDICEFRLSIMNSLFLSGVVVVA